MLWRPRRPSPAQQCVGGPHTPHPLVDVLLAEEARTGGRLVLIVQILNRFFNQVVQIISRVVQLD